MRPPRTVAGGRAVQFLLGAPPQLGRLLGDIADGKYGELLG
jgi:hypothetical protein